LRKATGQSYPTWINSHAGNYGNELADKLAKETARNKDIAFNRNHKCEKVQQARDQSIAK
jgi:ribonuclease HI